MRSVFALELVGDKDLTDVGRDMKPHWVVSMEELHADNGAVVLADVSCLTRHSRVVQTASLTIAFFADELQRSHDPPRRQQARERRRAGFT